MFVVLNQNMNLVPKCKGLWTFLAMDLHFAHEQEILDHLCIFGVLMSTHYHLAHTDSNLGYYLWQISWDKKLKFPIIVPYFKGVNIVFGVSYNRFTYLRGKTTLLFFSE